MVANYAALALRNVLSRKLRSSLTILGIVIGISAIIALWDVVIAIYRLIWITLR